MTTRTKPSIWKAATVACRVRLWHKLLFPGQPVPRNVRALCSRRCFPQCRETDEEYTLYSCYCSCKLCSGKVVEEMEFQSVRRRAILGPDDEDDDLDEDDDWDD